MRLELPPDPSSARLARRAVREVCERAGVPEEVPLLCASELVTNAVLHAAPPIELEILLLEGRIRVAVYDGSTGDVARRRPVRDDTTSGRGLAIVETLAAAWRVEATPHGKVVWFELDCP